MARIWLNLFPAYAAILLLMFVHSNITCAQNAPPSPERQWLGPGEQQIKRDAERFRDFNPGIDGAKIYSLGELIDFAQSHNPETRFAWERARAQAAALGVARSELYPTLAAVALSLTERDDILAGSTFVRQSIETIRVAFDVNYTLLDFGARAGRIDAAKAELLGANFAFNDTHRNIIFRVEKAYYELLNASGQVIAARTSLTNLAVTIVAAWFATSSPRLSYFGVQLALAFYIINLQEFKMQTSLTVARDRIIGILLGLFMMWLVFDQLWSVPAVKEMKKSFITSLRLLGQLSIVPRSKDIRVVIEQTSSLREKINTNLDRVRLLADAVLFEFGSSRQQDLALRRQIVRWQSEVRMLFLMETALMKYSLQLPGFELPEALSEAQQEFSHTLAQTLEGMADRIEGGPSKESLNFEDAMKYLERKI
jgi:hypothetical protein